MPDVSEDTPGIRFDGSHGRVLAAELAPCNSAAVLPPLARLEVEEVPGAGTWHQLRCVELPRTVSDWGFKPHLRSGAHS